MESGSGEAVHPLRRDALVYCGGQVSPDRLEITNPVVVIEVLSPGNAMPDLRDRFLGYFRVPIIAH